MSGTKQLVVQFKDLHNQEFFTAIASHEAHVYSHVLSGILVGNYTSIKKYLLTHNDIFNGLNCSYKALC